MINQAWIHLQQYLKGKVLPWRSSYKFLLELLISTEKDFPIQTEDNAPEYKIYNHMEKFINRQNPKFYIDLKEAYRLQNLLQSHDREWKNKLISNANDICNNRFKIFGLRDVQYDDEIDWHLDPLTYTRYPLSLYSSISNSRRKMLSYVDPKFRAELNRMQYLVPLSKAYLITGDERYSKKARKIISSWILSNPPIYGVYWRSALEVSLRLISWFWCIEFCKKSQSWDKEFLAEVFHSLYLQITYVFDHLQQREYPNNHLIGEAAVLAIAGIYLPEFKDAEMWKIKGIKILEDQIMKQTYLDGFTREQSTHYHRFVIDLYTLVLVLYQKNDNTLDKNLIGQLEKMYSVLLYLCQGDGTIPVIGDEDSGRAILLEEKPSHFVKLTLSTGSVLFNRGDMKHIAEHFHEESLWLLGAEGYTQFENMKSIDSSNGYYEFNQSGLYVKKSYSGSRKNRTKNNHLLFKCGPQGMGHAGHSHSDALSFILSAYGVPMIIDPGTYVYNAQPEWRNYFRGTLSHNTVTIDGLDQAVPISREEPFGWKEKCNTQFLKSIVSPEVSLWEGQHSGYNRLSESVIHSRSILDISPINSESYEQYYWIISDYLSGKGKHDIDSSIHLAPCEIESINGNQVIVVYPSGIRLFVYVLLEDYQADKNSTKRVSNHNQNTRLSIIQGWYSDEYGRKEQIPVIRLHVSQRTLPSIIHTLIFPLKEGETFDLSVEPIENTNGSGLQLFTKLWKHIYYYGKEPNNIEFENGIFKTDGKIAHIRIGNSNKLEYAAVFNGTYFEPAKGVLLKAPDNCNDFEILFDNSEYSLNQLKN